MHLRRLSMAYPLSPAAFNMSANGLRSDIVNRAEPSPEALITFRHFKGNFEVVTLQLDTNVCNYF